MAPIGQQLLITQLRELREQGVVQGGDLMRLVRHVTAQSTNTRCNWLRVAKKPLTQSFVKKLRRQHGRLSADVDVSMNCEKPELWLVKVPPEQQPVPKQEALQHDMDDVWFMQHSNTCTSTCFSVAAVLALYPPEHFKLSSRSLGLLHIKHAWVIEGHYTGRLPRNPLVVYQDVGRYFSLLAPLKDASSAVGHTWLRLLCSCAQAEDSADVLLDFDPTVQQFMPGPHVEQPPPLIWTEAQRADKAPNHKAVSMQDPSFASDSHRIHHFLAKSLMHGRRGQVYDVPAKDLPPQSMPPGDVQMPQYDWQVGDVVLLGSSPSPTVLFRRVGSLSQQHKQRIAMELGCTDGDLNVDDATVPGMVISTNKLADYENHALFDWDIVLIGRPVVVYIQGHEALDARVLIA